ncbi:MAG: bacteriocin [Saprospiraceae bacterium]
MKNKELKLKEISKEKLSRIKGGETARDGRNPKTGEVI